MKRQLSLKWNLTLGMLGIWVIISILIYFLLSSAMTTFNSKYIEMLKRDTASEGVVVATDVAYEVAAADKNAIVTKLINQTKKDSEIRAIVILDTKRNALFQSHSIPDLNRFVDSAKNISVGEAALLDNSMIGLATVTPEVGQVIGYVLVIKSIERYKKESESFVTFLLLMAVISAVIATASAYLIGRQLTKPINLLVAAAERIADGDLKKIDIEISGSYEPHRLGLSVKRMAEAMQSQVLAIKNLTSKISNISKETEGTMTNLASSAAQQAAAVNETAATVEEMEKAGQSSAVNAKHIVAAAEKTAEASKRGRQTVEKTYEIIMQIKDESHDISEKSKNLLNSVEEVGNIIQSVNSIAEQSKILAVNASIEAAKAGEFGSGFAVVAQEVKDLAQQSKDATLQITGTLTAIRAAIETMVSTAQRGKERTAEGVNTIANAGAVMNDLSEAIRENSDFAKLIATNIQQQTIGLTQIAAAIEEINTTALENQNISRSIVQGTKQMSDTLGLLSDMVGRWRTPEQSPPK